MRSVHRQLFLIGVISLTLGLLQGIALSHDGAEGIVKHRMEMFKKSKAELKAISKAIKEKDYDRIITSAQFLKNWSENIPDSFPAGSGHSPSEAAETIWTDFSGFEDKAARLGEAALLLEQVAMMRDVDSIKENFQELASTCKACHRIYRR